MEEKLVKLMKKFIAPCEYGITSSDISLVAKEIMAMAEFEALCKSGLYEACADEHLYNEEVQRRIKELFPTKKESQKKIAEILSNKPSDGIKGVISPAMIMNALDEWFREQMKIK